MSGRLLVSSLPGETRLARTVDGRLEALHIARADRPVIADSVYLGRVTSLDRSLAAAFVEIGLARPGLLPLAEAPPVLSHGDRVVVRVRREPSAEKGARLSARPRDIPDDAVTAAEGRTPPALLRGGSDALGAALSFAQGADAVVLDDPDLLARLRQALGDRAGADRLRFDPHAGDLFAHEGIEAQIDALLQPEVPLPSGGSLLIEPVRTLTAIDVNAGRHRGAAAGPAAVNREAAVEIARQIRLRNLSGLIVIDFLALKTAAQRERTVAALTQALADDPLPSRVYPMRPSGLVEMTRRRAGWPLHELLTEPCGIGGGGRVKDAKTLAFAALRAAQAAGRAGPARRLSLRAAPAVVAAVEGVAAPGRAWVEERLGRPLPVIADPGESEFRIVEE